MNLCSRWFGKVYLGRYIPMSIDISTFEWSFLFLFNTIHQFTRISPKKKMRRINKRKKQPTFILYHAIRAKSFYSKWKIRNYSYFVQTNKHKNFFLKIKIFFSLFTDRKVDGDDDERNKRPQDQTKNKKIVDVTNEISSNFYFHFFSPHTHIFF